MGVSTVGRERISKLINSNFLLGTTQVISSGEAKAIETGQMISASLGVSLVVNETMHENDRSATGYLPFDEFDAVANEFFAYPLRSVRGWERAADAQLRIVSAVESILKQSRAGDILLVGHGAVGTLLLCHYLNAEINRIHDQAPGGGQFFTLLKETRQVLHSWRQIEETIRA
ncbi:MAG TPA: histidine phosphatase family protein [Aestuariivirga sp.]|nr:histidine phosphatase family protein [Aestuariivirga sp.]